MEIRNLPPGHGWAYAGVALGLTASIAGNVANTVLVRSEVHLALRVCFAVIWPIFLGIGIEVLTRIRWERGWRHWGARAVLVGPMSLVSGFVSYLHLSHLLLLAGEPGPVQGFGPLAVDGTLFGCTVALLVTRRRVRIPAPELATLEAPRIPERIPAELPEPVRIQKEAILVAPRIPAGPEPAPQRSRSSAWDPVKVIRLILEGREGSEVMETAGIPRASFNRIHRAVKAIQEDRHAVIPAAWKVSAQTVQLIREEVAR